VPCSCFAAFLSALAECFVFPPLQVNTPEPQDSEAAAVLLSPTAAYAQIPEYGDGGRCIERNNSRAESNSICFFGRLVFKTRKQETLLIKIQRNFRDELHSLHVSSRA